MEERTFTKQEVEAMINEAVANYEKEQNVAALKQDLSDQLDAAQTAKVELDDAKAALESEREVFETAKTDFEESKTGYISPEEHDEKVKAAVNDAVALNERYHERIDKFNKAGIELDEVGLGKLRTEDDDFVEWLFKTVAKTEDTEPPKKEDEKKEEEGGDAAAKSTEKKEPANAAKAEDINETPPVGISTANDKGIPEHIAAIQEGLRKKLESVYGA